MRIEDISLPEPGISAQSRLDRLVADYAVPAATEVIGEAPVTDAVDMILSEEEFEDDAPSE